MTTPISIDPAALAALTDQVAGPVATPGDDQYDDEVRTWNLAFPQTPAVVVGATSTADVQNAVRFARAQRLPVAVTATGHNPLTPADGALLISLRRLTGIVVDKAARTATVEAAVESQDLVDAAAKAGLAPLVGSSP